MYIYADIYKVDDNDEDLETMVYKGDGDGGCVVLFYILVRRV